MKYIFRGNVVFDYNEERDDLTTEVIDGDIPAINFCNYIGADFENFERFFKEINEFRNGTRKVLKDIIV